MALESPVLLEGNIYSIYLASSSFKRIFNHKYSIQSLS